jgi:hypothetical protein
MIVTKFGVDVIRGGAGERGVDVKIFDFQSSTNFTFYLVNIRASISVYQRNTDNAFVW